MVDDNTLRAAFFGGLDGSGTGTAVFGAAGEPTRTDALINPLIDKSVGTGLASQPDANAIRDELGSRNACRTCRRAPGLINRLVRGPTGCERDAVAVGHESRVRCRARQRRDAHPVSSRENRESCIIRKKSPRTLGLDEPIRHESHKRPVTRRDFIAQGFLTGPGMLAAPSLLCAAHVRQAQRRCRRDLDGTAGATLRHHPAGAGKIPFICFDLAGGANLHGLRDADRQPATCQPTSCPPRATPSSACRATWRPTRRTPPAAPTTSSTSEFGAAWHSDGAHPARHAGFDAGGHARQRERLSDRRAFGERHRQQSSQPDVRHQPHRRRRTAADAHRLAEHRLGRQLDRADVDDGSGRAPHQGGSRERRHRPGRHRRARHAVRQHRRRGRGARIDDAPRSRQGRPVRDQARRRPFGEPRRRRSQGAGPLRLREVDVPRRPASATRPRSTRMSIRSSSVRPPASSRRPNTTPTTSSARPRPS